MMKPTPWRIGRLFLVAWILGAVASCKGSEEITKAEIPATPDETVDDLEELPEWQALGDEDYAVVRVFYGTDRNDTGDDDPADRFGPERGSFAYGSCDVSIPRDHRMGELEEPVIFKFLADPSKHVVLLDVDRVDADSFFVRVSRRIDRSSTREAFVFVHGYNVTFEDAARRTAQMSYDLAFDGAPIFYSWPSAGSLDGYARDESNIEWTTPHLREFLSDLALRSGAESIHLIAHSMGNRGLTRALADLAGTEARARFEEIILTAPDVDAEIFTRDILPRMRAEGSRITL
jgi:esterase/lipase superfamily enzyme